MSFRASAHTGVGIRSPSKRNADCHTSLRAGSQWHVNLMTLTTRCGVFSLPSWKTGVFVLYWFQTNSEEKYYGKDPFRMPRQSLKQGQYTKLCLLIPLFATSLTDLYYQRTTFERNHILPRIWHDTKKPSPLWWWLFCLDRGLHSILALWYTSSTQQGWQICK